MFKTISQRDPKWSKTKLGTSKTTTIGSHGCTITCIAMLAGLTPKEVNERLLKVKGYAKTNLVIWTKIEKAIPWLKFTWRGYSYNNAQILATIKKNGACLVEVDFDNNIRTDGKHWVLFTGNRKQNDPWTGNTTPTSKYSMKTGYATIEVVEKPESKVMKSDMMEIKKTVFNKLITEADAKDKKIKNLNKVVKQIEEELATKDKQIAAQKGLVTKKEKHIDDLDISIEDLNLVIIKDREKIARLEKPKKVEAIKDPMRYVVSLGVAALLTWGYTQFPVLGELQPDQQGLAVFLVGLIIKGVDKYQHETGKSLKLPF